MLNLRSGDVAPLMAKLSFELSDGPAFGAGDIDRRLEMTNFRAIALHNLTLHHTTRFHRLQKMTATAMADTCHELCRPYRSWKLWKDQGLWTFLSPGVHNAHHNKATLVQFHTTVSKAARIYHDNVVAELLPSVLHLNDSLGDAILEAHKAWTPLSSAVCHPIYAVHYDATGHYMEVPQMTWMRQFQEVLKGKQDTLSRSKHDLDHYLAAIDPQAWSIAFPADIKGLGLEDKKQWVWSVGKQVRLGVGIGSAGMKSYDEDDAPSIESDMSVDGCLEP